MFFFFFFFFFYPSTTCFEELDILTGNTVSRDRDYKTFFMLNSVENEIVPFIKIKYQQIKLFFLQSIAEHDIFLPINIKMPTIVGILIFISRKIYIFNSVEHEKSFIKWGPGYFGPLFNIGLL